jgi:hypothetical protein
MAALQTSKDYFREVLEPNRSDFLSDRTSLRFMANYVTSLYHLADWLGKSDLSFVQSQWGNSIKSKHDIWDYAESQVPDAGYIRDFANALKHMTLTKNPSTPMRHAAEAQSRGGGFDPKAFSEGFDVGDIYISVGATTVSLPPVCEELYKLWKALIDNMP